MTALGVEVVVTNLGSELYLTDVDVDLLLAGGLAGLFLLVLVLAVVHNPNHRWVRVWRHLHEVEVALLGVIHRVSYVLNSQLIPALRDETHRAGPDLAADPWFFFCGYFAPLLLQQNLRGRQTAKNSFPRSIERTRTPTYIFDYTPTALPPSIIIVCCNLRAHSLRELFDRQRLLRLLSPLSDVDRPLPLFGIPDDEQVGNLLLRVLPNLFLHAHRRTIHLDPQALRN